MIIKNRKGEHLSVVIDFSNNECGLAFVMHGLGGNKEQPQIRKIIDALKYKGYVVVSFDTTNTLGKSAGDYSRATVTNYLEDLEDVIKWAKNNSWYKEPFLLFGHSVGGLAVSLFAEEFPDKVKALAPLSSVISGEKWKEVQDKSMMKSWKKEGVWIRKDILKPERTKSLNWTFAEDIMKYDLLKNVDNLTMPVLLIVGEKDPTTPVLQQRIFFENLPGKKELHVIGEAEHVFRKKNHLDEIGEITENWLTSLHN